VLDLSLSSLKKGKPCDAWYKIPKRQGEIHITLIARDFGRVPKCQTFGVELIEIMKRETGEIPKCFADWIDYLEKHNGKIRINML
jgi:hypothetical protein